MKAGKWHLSFASLVDLKDPNWDSESEFKRMSDGKEYRILVWEKLQNPKVCKRVVDRRVAQMLQKLSQAEEFKDWFKDYVTPPSTYEVEEVVDLKTPSQRVYRAKKRNAQKKAKKAAAKEKSEEA